MNENEIQYDYHSGILLVVLTSSMKKLCVTSSTAHRIIGETIKAMAKTVVLDLKNISHLNSCIILMLLMVKNSLVDMGLDIYFVNANIQVQRVLQIVGLHQHLRSA
jgi:anti-anti-sigma factor